MTAFEFGLADLALRVSGPAAWVAPMRDAWAAWTPVPKSEPWSVTLERDATMAPPEGPLFDVLPRCRAGACALVAPAFEGQVSAKNGHAHLRAHPDATPADMGYFLRVALAAQAFVRGGMLFHTSAVVHHGAGYALFGLSGSGKTTASRLSRPDPVLNDDLVYLQPVDGGWVIHATPFGKRRGDLRSAPLRALLRLLQDTSVFLEPLPRSRALAELVANSPVVSGDGGWLPALMARWEAVVAAVPVYGLHFRKDPTFWEVIDAEFG